MGLHDINISRDVLAAFCRRHHVRRLSLFGSYLREDFGPDSDIDVLVEFESGATPSLLGMVELEQELTRLLGRQVDLRTPADLSRYFRDEVCAQAAPQYVHEP